MVQTILVHMNRLLDCIKEQRERGTFGSTIGVGFLMVVVLVIPFDISQLLLMVMGASLAALVQRQPNPKQKPEKKIAVALGTEQMEVMKEPPVVMQELAVVDRAHRKDAIPPWRKTSVPVETASATRTVCVRSESSLPVSAPTFKASDFSDQVDELAKQIAPTAACDHIIDQLVVVIKRTIAGSFPDANVMGVAFGDVSRRTAFAVAVPELHIIVNVTPSMLLQGLQERMRGTSRPDGHKLQKMAVQACTSLLLHQGHFKFRRSAFTSSEPKVTLIAPPFIGNEGDNVVLDVSVNSITPLYHSAVLQESGNIDARAKSLMLLVKRWAKYRGLCHAAKGHLSPYAWSLLTLYFLQVGSEEEPLLPSMHGASSDGKQILRCGNLEAMPASSKSVAELFHEFMHFYSKFNWAQEGVCVRKAKRAAPNLAMPLNVVHRESGGQEVGPIVECPFDPKKNAGSGITADALVHLRSELSRADELMSRNASLTELLTPWAPPEESSSTSATSEDSQEEVGRGRTSSGKPESKGSVPDRWAELRKSSERPPLRLQPRIASSCRTVGREGSLLQQPMSLRPSGMLKACPVAA